MGWMRMKGGEVVGGDKEVEMGGGEEKVRWRGFRRG